MTSLLLSLVPLLVAAEPARPNVVLLYADDIGYGDLGCYGAKRVKTPNVDRLAAQGVRFTDGHSASATCTPSRYAMMTGEYAWRKKGTNILPGDAALIIAPGRATMASVLKQAGYTAGVVGKWHLGLGEGKIDWNGEIKPGPREIGFDYSFIIPATGDRVPCVYVENGRVAGLDSKDPIQVSYAGPIGDEPTGAKHPELLKMKLSHGHDMTIIHGISRIGYMSGGKSARWKDEEMADVLTSKAVGFIEANKDRPFFLYLATHDIHVPRVPHPRFQGTSECGIRGDVIHQFDWCVGEVLATLDRLKLADNTLVILSSDNGPVIDDGYADGAMKDLNGHTPAGPLKGGKYSLYEGGHREPFLVRWPGHIKPGVSDRTVCQVDLVATFAALAGVPLPEGAAPDSFNVLPEFLGEAREPVRDHLVSHAQRQALRVGPWKLIPNDGPMQKIGPELYNLTDDVGETTNLAAKQPERVKEMTERLKKIREAGRSRP